MVMGKTKLILCVLMVFFGLNQSAWAVDNDEIEIIELPQDGVIQGGNTLEGATETPPLTEFAPSNDYEDPLRYTLGPEDVIEIAVMRHPEFSGVYPINMEGKIQYKFIGDLEVTGLTKKELEQKVSSIISNYVINPEINVTILEYKSKVIYVLGEVGHPGKYYMKADAIPIREAVVNAGLPAPSAAMRRSQLITPDKDGNVKKKIVDLYSILYLGNLKNNIEMQSGDVLYVPSTVMAKIIRVINPVTSAVGVAASAPSNAQTGRTATNALVK